MKQISEYTRHELIDLLTRAALDILSMEAEIGRLHVAIDDERRDMRRVHGFRVSDLEKAMNSIRL